MTDTCRLISSCKRMTFAQSKSNQSFNHWASSPLSAISYRPAQALTSQSIEETSADQLRTFSPKIKKQNLENENRNYKPRLTLSSDKILKLLNSILFPWSNPKEIELGDIFLQGSARWGRCTSTIWFILWHVSATSAQLSHGAQKLIIDCFRSADESSLKCSGDFSMKKFA